MGSFCKGVGTEYDVQHVAMRLNGSIGGGLFSIPSHDIRFSCNQQVTSRVSKSNGEGVNRAPWP